MNVRPILFSDAMVSAILREIEKPGTGKTQTRRIVKPQPQGSKRPVISWNRGVPEVAFGPEDMQQNGRLRWWRFPHGVPGDLLWVRETCQIYGHWRKDGFTEAGKQKWRFVEHPSRKVRYASDFVTSPKNREDLGFYTRPSIHMPRWASRLTLELTGVRVERLQDISGQDCWAEGIESAGWDCEKYGSVTHCYRDLWEQINGHGSWDANPWVWALTFKPHLMNVYEYLRRTACPT